MDNTENAIVEMEVSVKVRRGGETLEEVISATSKLTKADAGYTGADETDYLIISIKPDAQGNYQAANISCSWHGKLTKSSAGLKA
jgi:hypothetical protein